MVIPHDLATYASMVYRLRVTLLLRQRIRLLRCRTCVLPPVRWVIHLWNPALGTTFIVRTARSQNLGHPHLHLRQKRPDIVSGRMGVLTHICAAAVALVSPMQFSLLPTLSSSAVPMFVC